MTYATREDFVDRYGPDEALALDAGEAPVAEDGQHTYPRMTVALGDASVEMDSYLATRYALPIDPRPAGGSLLRRLCCALARELLYHADPPETVQEQARQARRILAMLGDGRMVLPGVAGDDPPELGGAEFAERTGPDPVMTDTNLAGL